MVSTMDLIKLNEGRQAKVYQLENQALKIMYLNKTTQEHFYQFNHCGIKNINGLVQYNSIRIYGLKIYIYMDLYRSDLFDFITNRNSFINEKEAKIIFKKLANTVKNLHDNGFVHRDIKPENILINDTTITKDSDIVLCDLEAFSNINNGYFSKLSYGTPDLAPEAQYFSIDTKLDIYSLGETMYNIVGREKVPISDSFKQLYNFMTKKNVEERYDINQILSHPWLQN